MQSSRTAHHGRTVVTDTMHDDKRQDDRDTKVRAPKVYGRRRPMAIASGLGIMQRARKRLFRDAGIWHYGRQWWHFRSMVVPPGG